MSASTSSAASAIPTTRAQSPKAPRVLACISCQQRKLKCDREFPCARCVKSETRCVPAGSIPRTRRKRFAEKELLGRLRHYEDLLRQHDVPYEPLHETPSAYSDSTQIRDASAATSTTSSATTQRGTNVRTHEAKDLWQAMNQTTGEQSDDIYDDEDTGNIQPDIVHNVVVQNAYGEMYENNDHLLFGAQQRDLQLSTLHPPSSRIFRLWQVFLDNVHPLLKVVHMSTLQARIVNAIDDLSRPSFIMHAMMFGIYCMAVHSLDEDASTDSFGLARTELLNCYHFACQQALLRCGVLRTNDRECLVALFFYLISTRDKTDPRTISSMFGVVVRLAQRMGIHSEAVNSQCSPFEAELRRRLWWALVPLDSRISDMAGNKAALLMTPTWDCKMPLNVDDTQLWPNMQTLPAALPRPSDALFVVVRSEIDDFVRNSDFFLDFTNPVLKPIARPQQDTSLTALERRIEDRFEHCTMDNMVHYMTFWTARGLLAKNSLLHYYSQHSNSSQLPAESQRDKAVSYCLRMLEADTALMISPLTKGYRWLIHFHFPFPAYVHIVQDIRRRPSAPSVERCWDAMSHNYEARFLQTEPDVGLFHRLIAKLIVRTWMDTQSGAGGRKNIDKPPRIVSHVLKKLGIADTAHPESLHQTAGKTGHDDCDSVDPPVVAHLDFYDGGEALQSLSSFCDMPEYAIDFDLSSFQWNAFDMPSIFAAE